MSKKYNEIEVKNNMNIEAESDSKDEVVEEKKQVQKVVSAQPKKVKRGLFSRLVAGVLGPEGLPGIGAYVNEEIVKPAIKNIIFDAITSAASMAMFGDRNGPRRAGGSHRRGETYSRPSTDYNRISNGSRHDSRERDRVVTTRHGLEEYVLQDRYDASEVLTALTEYADRYDKVSIADYYELIGVMPKFTDNNYGWSIDSIHRATIVHTRGGYTIKFPPVEVL